LRRGASWGSRWPQCDVAMQCRDDARGQRLLRASPLHRTRRSALPARQAAGRGGPAHPGARRTKAGPGLPRAASRAVGRGGQRRPLLAPPPPSPRTPPLEAKCLQGKSKGCCRAPHARPAAAHTLKSPCA
jgi:hypothetical protein